MITAEIFNLLLQKNDYYGIPVGATVVANYCDVAVSGTVVDSRVKYGKDVQYTIKSTHSVVLPFGINEVRPAGTIFLITQRDVLSVNCPQSIIDSLK